MNCQHCDEPIEEYAIDDVTDGWRHKSDGNVFCERLPSEHPTVATPRNEDDEALTVEAASYGEGDPLGRVYDWTADVNAIGAELPLLPHLPEIQYETLAVSAPPVVIASGRYYGETKHEIRLHACDAFAAYLEITPDEVSSFYWIEVTDAEPTDAVLQASGVTAPWSALVTCYEKEES